MRPDHLNLRIVEQGGVYRIEVLANSFLRSLAWLFSLGLVPSRPRWQPLTEVEGDLQFATYPHALQFLNFLLNPNKEYPNELRVQEDGIKPLDGGIL